MHLRDCIAIFLCGISWHHSRPLNSEPQVFVTFVALYWWRIASPIMDRVGFSFRHLLQDWIYFTTHKTFRSSVGKWRHKICKFAAEIFRKNRPQSCAKYFEWLLLRWLLTPPTKWVLVWLYPAGIALPSMWCFWFLVTVVVIAPYLTSLFWIISVLILEYKIIINLADEFRSYPVVRIDIRIIRKLN